jgi:hypothetical protein
MDISRYIIPKKPLGVKTVQDRDLKNARNEIAFIDKQEAVCYNTEL